MASWVIKRDDKKYFYKKNIFVRKSKLPLFGGDMLLYLANLKLYNIVKKQDIISLCKNSKLSYIELIKEMKIYFKISIQNFISENKVSWIQLN